ncbi:MAG: hypothetical protein WBB29_07185 [Geitlerinemataceae cyanobacterium]
MRADRKVAHRVFNTLRYIHGNPKAAKMRSTFFYEFGNYGSYERLTDDGLTQWHPAFLQLGSSLEDCAKKYKGFCQRYKPKSKEVTYSRRSQVRESAGFLPTPAIANSYGDAARTVTR